MEQFWLIVWPHVCYEINNFLRPTSCVKPLRTRHRNQFLNPSYAILLAIAILLTFIVSSCILNLTHTISAKNHGFGIWLRWTGFYGFIWGKNHILSSICSLALQHWIAPLNSITIACVLCIAPVWLLWVHLLHWRCGSLVFVIFFSPRLCTTSLTFNTSWIWMHHRPLDRRGCEVHVLSLNLKPCCRSSIPCHNWLM